MYSNFDREGSGGAEVYILCLEEFSSVGMLPPGGSSVFWMLPPRTFTTSGLRNSADFRVHVAEAKNGWIGSSPLIVSFYAPTWLVSLEPRNAIIAFGIQSTPQSTMTFVKTLGLDMNVYDTTLRDEDNFYITKHLPHQSAYAAVCGIADADVKINDPLNKAIRTTIKAKVNRKTARIVELSVQVAHNIVFTFPLWCHRCLTPTSIVTPLSPL